MTGPVVRVSAAVVTDGQGRALVVRKRGTEVFMQPGGKPEPGENPIESLVRELAEEIGVDAPVTRLRALGRFETDAANEPGHRVIADAFALELEPDSIAIGAEIAEARWITSAEASAVNLAPLSRDLLLPLVWG